MMEIQDKGKVLCLSLTMKVHNFTKKRRSEYQFRRRIANGDIERVTITPIKPRKGEISSGYFLHDIQPHRIPLPPASRYLAN